MYIEFCVHSSVVLVWVVGCVHVAVYASFLCIVLVGKHVVVVSSLATLSLSGIVFCCINEVGFFLCVCMYYIYASRYMYSFCYVACVVLLHTCLSECW